MDASEALETIASAIEVHYLDGYDASDPVYVVIRDAFRNLITAMVEQKFVTQSDVASSWEENLSVITDNWEPDKEDEYDLSFGDLTDLQADGSALRFREEDVLLRYMVDDLFLKVPESELGHLVQTFLRSI
jgi:hypothetical protein